jgi:hypothetical protein
VPEVPPTLARHGRRRPRRTSDELGRFPMRPCAPDAMGQCPVNARSLSLNLRTVVSVIKFGISLWPGDIWPPPPHTISVRPAGTWLDRNATRAFGASGTFHQIVPSKSGLHAEIPLPGSLSWGSAGLATIREPRGRMAAANSRRPSASAFRRATGETGAAGNRPLLVPSMNRNRASRTATTVAGLSEGAAIWPQLAPASTRTPATPIRIDCRFMPVRAMTYGDRAMVSTQPQQRLG